MNESIEIASALRRLAALGELAILATVVRVEGSAYRRPGARMLVTPSGERIGCVSGGCLERDARLRGARLAPDEAVVVSYDSRQGEETPWDLALGCNGKVDLLIERLSPGRAQVLGEFFADVHASHDARVVATLIEAPGVLELQRGARAFCHASGGIVQTDEAAALLDALPPLQNVLSNARQTETILFETEEGKVELLVEVIHPSPPLVVFGAGWDAAPVVDAGKALGWHVTVVDHRGGYATKEHFARADERVVGRGPEEWKGLSITGRTAAVVMTHDYKADLEILASMLARPIGYLGLLGPRSRTERLLAELRDRGRAITTTFQNALHAPVGLALGAETPAEIALSIIGEITAWRTGSCGGFLRHHNGPIHLPAAAPAPVIAVESAQGVPA